MSRPNYDYIAEDGEPIPTRAQILAARVVLKGTLRLGREVPPGIVRDANWPLKDAAPPPEADRPAS
jgi:hypothetical protein